MYEEGRKFIAEMQKSLQNATFVKLTLSNYKGPEEHLQRISARPVETKRGRRIAFQYRYATRDVVKNYTDEQAAPLVARHLESGFRNAHLFTIERDFQLTVGKRSARLVAGKATFASSAPAKHDREKQQLVDVNAYYLKALGITTDSGNVRSDHRDKWTQINKFVEVLDGLIRNSRLKDRNELTIVDVGSGKGYLTFAVYDHLTGGNATGGERAHRRRESTIASTHATVTGVEQRHHLVSLCNDIARVSGFDGLEFVHGTIADLDLEKVDILIALHACDTATDDALYKGIRANAEIIVAAPCCHHEIKKQMDPPELLAGILKHPVLLERTAETVTDGLRSLLLELSGYKTKMFEFVATEHTPKNILLVATRVARPSGSNDTSKMVSEILKGFGIRHQRLADLLKGERADAIRCNNA